MRQFVLAVALVAAWCPCGRSVAEKRSEIIPEATAARHGLTRPWFTQIRMDPSRSRVQDMVLHEGVLYVQTDRAMIQAIDAETGETLWAKQVGRPNHPSLTPAAGEDLLAIINGSRLYVCNRYNGDLLYEIQVDGVPGAGPCLGDRRVYVPMLSGRLVAYRLDPVKEPDKVAVNPTPKQTAAAEQDRRENLRLRQEFVPPVVCQSSGRILVQPLVTRQTAAEEFVAWATDRGYLYIGSIDRRSGDRVDRRSDDRLAVKYRLSTAEGIAARPTYLPPDPAKPEDSGVIFAASRDGYVYAVREGDGKQLWRGFPTGEPIVQPAVVIDERLYVATQPGGMYCLSAMTGDQVWWVPQIRQFIAASKQRVYAADMLGRVLILSADTGTRLDTMAVEFLPIKLVNSDTDRLYLATETGLIQCLHEVELSQPIHHGEARKKKPPPQEQPGIEQKGIETPKPKKTPGAPKKKPPAAKKSPFS